MEDLTKAVKKPGNQKLYTQVALYQGQMLSYMLMQIDRDKGKYLQVGLDVTVIIPSQCGQG